MTPPALGSSVDAPPRAYAALLEHAELELELAGSGQVDRLAALGARWDELTRGLPATPPAAAASLLERALLIHERTRIELIRLREALLADLASAGRAKRAAEGYGAQLSRRSRLERSA
jgi:hypothetical protein